MHERRDGTALSFTMQNTVYVVLPSYLVTTIKPLRRMFVLKDYSENGYCEQIKSTDGW